MTTPPHSADQMPWTPAPVSPDSILPLPWHISHKFLPTRETTPPLGPSNHGPEAFLRPRPRTTRIPGGIFVPPLPRDTKYPEAFSHPHSPRHGISGTILATMLSQNTPYPETPCGSLAHLLGHLCAPAPPRHGIAMSSKWESNRCSGNANRRGNGNKSRNNRSS